MTSIRSIARQADVLFPSEGELDALGLDEAELLEAGAVICTTLGAKGARVPLRSTRRARPRPGSRTRWIRRAPVTSSPPDSWRPPSEVPIPSKRPGGMRGRGAVGRDPRTDGVLDRTARREGASLLRLCGGPTESRSMSCVRNTIVLGAPSRPSRRRRSASSAAPLAMSAIGWRTVVMAGTTMLIHGMSSNATSETSRGTLRPSCSNAMRDASARMLFAAKTAVGAGRARIRSAASSMACSRWNEPVFTSSLRSGMPCSLRARSYPASR